MKYIALILVAGLLVFIVFGITNPADFATSILESMQSVADKFTNIMEKLSGLFDLPISDIVRPAPIGGAAS